MLKGAYLLLGALGTILLLAHLKHVILPSSSYKKQFLQYSFPHLLQRLSE